MLATGFGDLADRIAIFVELFVMMVVMLGGVFGFLAQQCFAVFARNLVIIGVNFRKRQEAVAVAAIFDKGCLQRGFDPGYLGKIDVALELLAIGSFKVELLNPLSIYHGNPGFFRVAGVDQHTK